MTTEQDPIEALALAEEVQVTHVSQSTVSAIVRSEVESQLDAAHRYPRSIARFLKDAKTLATLTQEVAEDCIYTLPRGGKTITGPSVRLAEIMSSAYGNLQVGARVVGTEENFVLAQGAAWDMERNLRATIEIKRRITNKFGKRYDDDMIGVTGNAAASIGLRNAIFRVIPRAYVNVVMAEARRVAVGDATTLDEKRRKMLGRLTQLGITKERALARVGKAAIEDVGLEELETWIGLGTAIKDESVSVDEAFPEIPTAAPGTAPEEQGKRISLKGKKDLPHSDTNGNA